MMASVEDCKLGKELISEIVRYYSENPVQRPLIDYQKTSSRTEVIRKNSAIMMTFKQTSSLARLLNARRNLVEPHLNEKERLAGINSPSVREVKKEKKQKKQSRESGLVFQKELQKQFVDGKPSVLQRPKGKKKKGNPFSTLRSMMKNKDEKDTKDNSLREKPRKRRRGKSKNLSQSQPLSKSLRRSDSDLQSLIKQMDAPSSGDDHSRTPTLGRPLSSRGQFAGLNISNLPNRGCDSSSAKSPRIASYRESSNSSPKPHLTSTT